MVRWSLLLACGFAIPVEVVRADDTSPEAVEFFEKRIRPVLVEKCFECHGPNKPKGNLRLDSRGAMLKGGDTGPAVTPGEAKSLLLEAVSYDPDGYQMPPKGKLPDSVIADFKQWVRDGAVWPTTGKEGTQAESGFDLAERAKHWSFQPLHVIHPPDVTRAAWSNNPVDRFILARLDQAGLSPAPPADRRVWLRRVTFELTGLPPTLMELDDYLADDSPLAEERVVDRLLTSPRHGERWARHWLDLVRFAETSGHEFDYEISHATPYRDYVVRAFNADLPYDQFVTEQLAGDLIPSPRRDPVTGRIESVIGTACYWFGQGKHSPVDLRAEECDTVDNQLDVLGKTFLGLTIACARCHDHKFDPIRQRDYYALAGFLQSSRQTYADTNPPEATQAIAEALTQQVRAARSELLETSLASIQPVVERLPELLGTKPSSLPAEFLAAWRKRLDDEAMHDRGHPLHLWSHAAAKPDDVVAMVRNVQAAWRQESAAAPVQVSHVIPSPMQTESVDGSPPPAWFWQGPAFQFPPTSGLPWLFGTDPRRPIRGVANPQGWAHSGMVSTRLQGTLRSPTFTISTKYIDYLAHRRGGDAQPARGSKHGQVHLIIDGFQFIRNPLYGSLTINVPQRDTLQWMRQDVSKWIGSNAYIEIEDLDDGEIIVDRIEFRDDARPLDPFHRLVVGALGKTEIRSIADLAAVYQQVCQQTVDRIRQGAVKGAAVYSAEDFADGVKLHDWLFRQRLPDEQTVEAQSPAARFAEQRQQREAAIPRPVYTMAMTDGTAEDEHLLVRGNPHRPGEPVRRQFLEVLDHAAIGPNAGEIGSGRWELANRLIDPRNPLVARVVVNRLWQHLFGRGLVPTPDDFGKMGQPPSHPELLDWLAHELIQSGWSLKHIQRLLATSQTFRQSTLEHDPRALETDPQNVLLHHMSIQRLEAEAIRDALLLVSGRLDERLGGPSVMPHLTPFMEGRGRPGQSGALDGDGRRSLYINVRRNFLSPFFLAFDFPTPFTTMGRRTSSNVPAQALSLMNNPFIVQQTSRWADAVSAETLDPRERIRRFYRCAFGRLPTEEETMAAMEFLGETAANDPQTWRDLAHVLVNVKEFVFVE